MKKQLLTKLVGLFFILTTINVNAQTAKNEVLAVVNDVKINADQINELVRYIKTEGGNLAPDAQPRLLEEMIVKEAVTQDITRQGLLKKPEYQFKLKLAQQNVAVDVWFSEYLKKNPVSEMDIKSEYEAQLKRSKEPRNQKEFNVSQIVLTSEERANEVIKELNGGVPFEDLAKKQSLHKQSSDNGGNLGWALPAQLVVPLGDVVLNVPKGKIGALPVKTTIGWHVVRVNDIRDYVFPSLDKIKGQITNYLVQQKRTQAISELMTKTKVVRN